MPTQEHVSIVERWFEDLFTRGDLDAVEELVAPDFIAHGQDCMEDIHSLGGGRQKDERRRVGVMGVRSRQTHS